MVINDENGRHRWQAGDFSIARRSVVYKPCRFTPDARMNRGKTTGQLSSRMAAPEALDPLPGVRPFLKWVGGKRQLLRELRRYVPRDFPAYHEPFLGSGALFFDLWRSNRLHGTACHLGDANPDLVGVYRALAEDTENVIERLRLLASEHQHGGAEAYYRVRDEFFNPERRSRQSAPPSSYPAHLAAMFIYLNRTGYNGLFRLNSQGDFNVPAGRYAAPRVCDEPTLRAAAAVLRSPSVTLHHRTYTAVADAAGPGDLVYFDPPYAPLSATARFTSYTAGSFSEDDQRALQRLVVQLAERGCQVVVSNSTAALVTGLYRAPEARRAGLRIHRIPARRAINSNATRRGAIDEYIISNVRPS
jgi:DNA adenine methylase